MQQITLRDHLKYRFDNFMSKGTGALILALLAISLVVIVIISALIMLFGIVPDNPSFEELLWGNLMRLIDAGTVAGDTGSWTFLFLMLLVTAVGVFIFSTFIGVLTTGLESKIERLQKGRSLVAEKGHTVILGWSPQIFSVIKELILANENQSSACVVVMADKDKMEMEDELRDKLGKTGNTRLVCRTGDPIDMDDLLIVRPGAAKSIIVLPEEEDSDASTLKIVLALNNILGDTAPTPHVTAIIRDRHNLPAAKVAGQKRAVYLTANEILARITAQTSMQPGLSQIVVEILEFAGNEIYFHTSKELAGKTFLQAAMAFEHSAVMGLYKADGRILLNPPMDCVLQDTDQIICLSEDDDTIQFTGTDKPSVDNKAISIGKAPSPAPERILVLGWNRLASMLVKNLDEYVMPESEVHIVAENAPDPEQLSGSLKHVSVETLNADPTNRYVLDELNIPLFHHVVVLSDAELPPQRADANTLATLLHLRDIAEKGGVHSPIISQILDSRTQTLAQVARANDFIVSDRLLSLMLAQVSESPGLANVFDELFSSQGAELYLKPASLYVKEGATISFTTLIEAASRRKETAIGYRLADNAQNADKQFGVVLNPANSASFALKANDAVIVLAENAE